MDQEATTEFWSKFHKALRRKLEKPLTEKNVHELLAENPKPSDRARILANILLGAVGTEASLPFLIEHAEHPKLDVASTAISALARLPQKSAIPIILKCLKENRNPYVKQSAVFSLNQIGDETCIEALSSRVMGILKNRKSASSSTMVSEVLPNELVVGLQFLSRYAHEKSVAELFRALEQTPERLTRVEWDFVRKYWGGQTPDIPVLKV